MKNSYPRLLAIVLLSLFCITAHATTWTTRVKGDITVLTNWTDGFSTPTGFTNPGDTWVITDSMNISPTGHWIVGATSGAVVSVIFAVGSSLIDTSGGAPSISIYGNVIDNGGAYFISGAGATPTLNIYGNTMFNAGSFTVIGDNAHFVLNSYGTFNMPVGSISVNGMACNNTINFYGDCNLSGTSVLESVGAGATGAVHFGMPPAPAIININNSSTGTWIAMDVFIDNGCAAQLNGTFTTTTGTVANGLTVNGMLICPANYYITGVNNFSLNAGGTLVVAHTAGIDSAILTTGAKTFSDSASYEFDGIFPQVPGALFPTTLSAQDTLIINNGAGVTLLNSLVSKGVLKFLNGMLYTDTNSITLPGDPSSVTGAGPHKYIVGTLHKTITGDTVVNFEIGDSAAYLPLTLIFDSAGTAGSITTTVTYGPDLTAGSSAISPYFMVNDYWTVSTDSAAGPSKVKIKATYGLADIIGGDNEYFCTQHYDGTFWLATAIPSFNTVSPYTTMADSTIAFGAIQGDYIFGRVTGALGIKGNAQQLIMKLLPNPNNGDFTLKLQATESIPAEVAITNILGEQIKQFAAMTNADITISIDNTPGIYFIKASAAYGASCSSFVIR